MEIDDAGELIFQTYYMVDWKSTLQKEAEARCITCRGAMAKVGPVRDKKGLVYEGLACHNCKSIFWLKRG